MLRDHKAVLVSTLAAGLFALPVAAAHGAMVKLDFSDVGPDPESAAGAGTWNVFRHNVEISLNSGNGNPVDGFDPYGPFDLMLYDGNGDSGWDLTVSGMWSSSGTAGNTGAYLTTLAGDEANAADDYIYLTALADLAGGGEWGDEEGTLTISGLDVGALYDVRVIAARSSDNNRDGDYSIQGGTAVNFDGHEDGYNNGDVLSFLNVAPDGTGAIVLHVDSLDDGYAYVNAMTVELVPEPASLALLGLGGLAMLGRRRKQA